MVLKEDELATLPGDNNYYHCPPHISWCVEKSGLILINGNSGATCWLGYPEAAAWDLLSRGYKYESVLKMLRFVAAMDAAAGESFLHDLLKGWLEKGLILIREKA